MSPPLTPDFLGAVLHHLAGSDWASRHLALMVSAQGNGVVTGAEEHFEALRQLSVLDMDGIPLPSRFCMPGEFDE